MRFLVERYVHGALHPYRFIPKDDTHLTKDEIRASLILFDEMDEWCSKQIGPGGFGDDARWVIYSWGFYFKHETDAVGFKLRFG